MIFPITDKHGPKPTSFFPRPSQFCCGRCQLSLLSTSNEGHIPQNQVSSSFLTDLHLPYQSTMSMGLKCKFCVGVTRSVSTLLYDKKTLWVSSFGPPPYFQPPEPLETMVESSGSIHVCGSHMQGTFGYDSTMLTTHYQMITII